MMKNRMITLVMLAVLGTVVCGHGAELGEAELIGILNSDAGRAEKADACRQLGLVGTAAAVPTLAALLGDADLSHMARYALEPIPGPGVEAALRDALGKVGALQQVGIIGSLGVRRDAAATGLLIPFLTSAEVDVREAAARALGRIGTAEAGRALEAALSSVAPESQLAVIEGVFRCAEALAGADQGDKSMALYDRLRVITGAPHQVRTGALRGAVLTRGDAGLPILLDALRNEDFGMVGAAIRTAQELPGAEVTKALASSLVSLLPDTQVLLSLTLGKRGDAGALPGLTALARKGAVPARIAAIRALTEIGDASATTVLVQLQSDGEEDVARVAREALGGLQGSEVDVALAAMLKDGHVQVKCAAIDLLGQRRATGAIPGLLQAARSAEENVQIASLNVLGDLGGTEQLPELVGLLLTTRSAPSLKACEGALSAICKRLAQAEPGRVTIRKALYGDLPDGPSKDVTAVVASMVRSGELTIVASNATFGDAAPGVPKRMRLDYTVDGVAASETVRENDSVEIKASVAPPAVTASICAGLPAAKGEVKLALLRILRSAGGDKALAAVRATLSDPDTKVREAGMSILCEWTTPEALPDLLELARTAETPRTKVLALRGCCRLIPLQAASADQKLAHVKQVLALADRADEKRLALSALAGVHVVDALAIATNCMSEVSLKEEACLAAVNLGEHLAPTHRTEVAEAMQQVLNASSSAATKKRAQVALDKTKQTK